MTTTTTTNSSPSCQGVPLPRLSDATAVEVYLFIEHVFQLFESCYGDQIRRHFDDLAQHNLTEPDFASPPDDPPF